jgi:hypothetical protein
MCELTLPQASPRLDVGQRTAATRGASRPHVNGGLPKTKSSTATCAHTLNTVTNMFTSGGGSQPASRASRCASSGLTGGACSPQRFRWFKLSCWTIVNDLSLTDIALDPLWTPLNGSRTRQVCRAGSAGWGMEDRLSGSKRSVGAALLTVRPGSPLRVADPSTEPLNPENTP